VARKYHLGVGRKLVNVIITALLRAGVPMKSTYLLTVKGRRSGKPHTTPVILVEHADQRWLVSPYGIVGWVRNARAAGQVTLTRKRRSETVAIAELGPNESAPPILKEYVTNVSVVRPFFQATRESPVEAFAAEASTHPVFRLAN
jgi:deazaflavin-dependent oxidoreductase (nitroreductase family)